MNLIAVLNVFLNVFGYILQSGLYRVLLNFIKCLPVFSLLFVLCMPFNKGRLSCASDSFQLDSR